MSMERRESFPCPRCGRKTEFTVWESLNGNLDPEAKQQLLNGTLFRFTCRKCGFQGEVDYPILYNDMTHRAMVYYVHEEDVEETKEGLKEARKKTGIKMPEYRLRIVTSQNALREKAIIFENGLDDRVVEFLKYYYGKSAREKYRDITIREIYFLISEGQYLLQLLGDRVITLELPKSEYERMNMDLKDIFAAMGDNEMLIGQDWVHRLLQI